MLLAVGAGERHWVLFSTRLPSALHAPCACVHASPRLAPEENVGGGCEPRWLVRTLQAGGDQERLKLQLQELARENQLLKRAVAIQNTRMQVRARVNSHARVAFPALLAF